MKIRVLAWLLIVSLLLPSISSADSADTSQLLDNESIETQTLQDFLLQANRDYDDNDEVEIIVTLDENHFGGLGEEVPANLLYNDFYLNKQQNYGNQILEEAFSRFEKNGILIEPMVTYNTLFVGFATQTTFATAKKIANTDFVKMVEMSVERNKPTLSPQEVAGGFRSASFYKPLSEMIEPINSRDLVGSEEVFKNNKGEGMVIAIIDSGYDLEHQSFYLTDLGKSKAKLNQTTVEGIVNSGSVSKGKYHNEKIPFIYSYINKNTKMKEAKFASHGQHVAGIAAGNSVKYKSGNKEGNFIGIAPESQLLLMRVFSDESPTTSSVHYTKALEDALHLKADSVNMSLGSPAGDHRSTEKTTVNAINRLSQAGCVVAIAAGNDTAFGNAAQRKPDVNNPDYGILATPALIDRSLAVASLQHDTVTLKYADVLDDKKQVVKSYALDWQETTKEYAPNKEYSFVYVNLGKKSDFNESLEGKYALIERGEIPFGEKVQNAMEHNAAGVIIFNSQQGGENFFKMSGVKDFPIPVAAMKRDSGLFLKENPNTHLKFSKHEGTFDSDSKGKLSEFSSFGLTADATFKPEITAPGGNIYSLANNNGFSNQSGTSMASPQVAGGIALVKNRVNRDFSYLSDEQRWQMVKKLLMSTAKIHYNTETGAASSPRNQGAGIMNLSAALSSNIVLRSGEFGETKIIHTAAQPQQEINFSVLNYSDKAESFKYKAVVVRDEVENGHFTLRPSAIKTIEGSDIQVEAKSSNNAPGQTNITMTIDTSEVADQLSKL